MLINVLVNCVFPPLVSHLLWSTLGRLRRIWLVRAVNIQLLRSEKLKKNCLLWFEVSPPEWRSHSQQQKSERKSTREVWRDIKALGQSSLTSLSSEYQLVRIRSGKKNRQERYEQTQNCADETKRWNHNSSKTRKETLTKKIPWKSQHRGDVTKQRNLQINKSEYK